MNLSTAGLVFQGVALNETIRANKAWVGGTQIGLALRYANPETAITKIFNRHADEFSASMTGFAERMTAGGKQLVRVFSLRGAHLLAMFARTPVAKAFRRWVLDILDQEVVRVRPARVPGLDGRTRENLVALCNEVEFVRSWWSTYGALLEGLSPRVAGQVSEHIIGAAAAARHMVRDHALPTVRDYATRYPWRGNEVAQRAYVAADQPARVASG